MVIFLVWLLPFRKNLLDPGVSLLQFRIETEMWGSSPLLFFLVLFMDFRERLGWILKDWLSYVILGWCQLRKCCELRKKEEES